VFCSGKDYYHHSFAIAIYGVGNLKFTLFAGRGSRLEKDGVVLDPRDAGEVDHVLPAYLVKVISLSL
jgi:hypothetical protein